MGTLESAKTQETRGKLAHVLIRMKHNISEPIAAILIMNTIANTAGATLAGMYAAKAIGPGSVIVFSLFLTGMILFLSEIFPKTIGAIYWRSLWPYVVYPLKFLKFALLPFIYVTQKATSTLRMKQKGKTITEDEILALVHLGAREGEISKDESQMVRNIIHLEEIPIENIMTPRRVVYSLPEDLSIHEATDKTEDTGHSRIPVYSGDKENVTGYILVSELRSKKVQENEQESVSNLRRPLPVFPELTNCLTLLIYFLKNRTHMAIVQDEYGGLSGILTLEDILETILGKEIIDETDQDVDMREVARKKFSKPKDEH
jgi:CBS domain containing-hemolysin-like protein